VERDFERNLSCLPTLGINPHDSRPEGSFYAPIAVDDSPAEKRAPGVFIDAEGSFRLAKKLRTVVTHVKARSERNEGLRRERLSEVVVCAVDLFPGGTSAHLAEPSVDILKLGKFETQKLTEADQLSAEDVSNRHFRTSDVAILEHVIVQDPEAK
jgi:hypothetical protein